MMDICNELYKVSCRALGLQCIKWPLTLPSDLSRALQLTTPDVIFSLRPIHPSVFTLSGNGSSLH